MTLPWATQFAGVPGFGKDEVVAAAHTTGGAPSTTPAAGTAGG